MKKYLPYIAVILIVLIGALARMQDQRTARKLLDIEKELIRSEAREELHLEQLERLTIEHRTISVETIPINKKHHEIRATPIPTSIRDSLARSIILRGQARFD